MAIDEVAFSILVHSPLLAQAESQQPAGASLANLVQNPGFETAGGGGADVFASWTEDTDGGNATFTQSSTTPSPHAGSYYCEVYSVNGGDVDASLSQDITVLGGTTYYLSIYSRTGANFASMQGRWGVYDNTNTAWIVTREGTALFSDQEWQKGSLYFRTPANCTSIKLYLYQNYDGDSTVYYDSVSLTRVPNGRASLIEDYGRYINSYSHSISVNVGYDTMTMDIAGSLEFIISWLAEGLGRHIVVREAGSGIVWEGFVNKITMNAGSFSMSTGPYKDIINRGRIVYNHIDWTTTPAIGGDTVVGPWKDSLLSQLRYGILEGIISGGEGDSEEMDALLNYLMEEIAWAPSESSFSLGSGSNFSATIECFGYGHLLEKYYYTRIVGGEENASSKIVTVLDRSPNAIYTYSLNSTIVENTEQVEAYDDGTRTPMAIFKDIANLGDANNNRYIFGVYKDRVFEYRPVLQNIEYTTRIDDGRIERGEATGIYVKPWEVMPGRWLQVLGVSIGARSYKRDDSATEDSNIRHSEDPSKIFIEKVSYTAPYGLSITSGRASTFRQRLDRLGLGGI